MEISQKVAYLKGLAEGLALDTESKEGKLIAAIIDVLDDMSEKFSEIDDELCDVEDGLDAVSDDLSDVEETIYEMDDEDEDEEDYDEDDESEDCFDHDLPLLRGADLLRRERSGVRRDQVPELRREAGVRPERSGQRRRGWRGRGVILPFCKSLSGAANRAARGSRKN